MAQTQLKAVILTALPVEYEAVRAALGNCQEEEHPVSRTIYERGEFIGDRSKWEVGIVEIGQGNVDAGIETNRAIDHFKPDVVMFVGIAGGIKDVEIGDVVAATKIYGYEPGKAEAEKFKTRVCLAESSYALVQRAKKEAGHQNRLFNSSETLQSKTLHPHVWVAPIAAGEKVVASKKSPTYKRLEDDFSDAVAVEMEGYGFSRAVYSNASVSSIVIRGISDLIDGKGDNDKYGPEPERQQKASEHASAFAFRILDKFNPHLGVTEGIGVSPHVESPFFDGLFACMQSTDLAVLTEALKIVTSASEQSYVFGEVQTFSALQKALSNQNDKKLALDWVEHLLCEAQQNAVDQIHGPVLSQSQVLKLQTWYDKNKLAEVQPPASTSSPPEQLAYLLISLDPRDDEGTVAFMAELHKPDGQIQTDLVEQGILCSVEEPEEILSDLLSKTISKALQTIREASKASKIKTKTTTTIEVFLSYRHLHKPVHQWKAKFGLAIQPLRNFRRTLVRCLERVTLNCADEWDEMLEAQLTCLQGCESASLPSRSRKVTELDYDELLVLLEDAAPSCLILKLLMVLPEDLQEREQMLNALFQSGVPLWFWAYQTPTNASDLSTAIDELLTADNLKEAAMLAEAARKKRKQLPDLGLLFECHTRKPRLPVVTKSDHLRQPAA